MSRAVDGLFERGFVGREEDSEDRRMKRVRPTDAGRTVPQALNRARLSALQELLSSPASVPAVEQGAPAQTSRYA